MPVILCVTNTRIRNSCPNTETPPKASELYWEPCKNGCSSNMRHEAPTRRLASINNCKEPYFRPFAAGHPTGSFRIMPRRIQVRVGILHGMNAARTDSLGKNRESVASGAEGPGSGLASAPELSLVSAADSRRALWLPGKVKEDWGNPLDSDRKSNPPRIAAAAAGKQCLPGRVRAYITCEKQMSEFCARTTRCACAEGL